MLTRLGRDEAGQATFILAAVLLVISLVLFFTVANLSTLFMERAHLDEAARNAASSGAVVLGKTCASVAPDPGVAIGRTEAVWQAATGGRQAIVTASCAGGVQLYANYSTHLLGVAPLTIQVGGRAAARMEGGAP